MAQFSRTTPQIDAILDEVVAARGDSASLSAEIATKQDALTFDSTPTENSTNPVTSGGVYSAVSAKCALSDVYGMGVVLQPTAEEPADMDSITTVGAYTCSATYIANLAHRPESKTSVNLYFEVRRLTSTRWMQTAYYQSNDADSFYIRWKTLNSWTAWRKFTGTAV